MALYIGLMSGTSLDGIDAALVDIDDGISLRATLEYPLPASLRGRLLELTQPGNNEIEKLGIADRELGQVLGQAVIRLLEENQLSAADIHAIGSHGQTLRHRPPGPEREADQAFTLQIGDPNTIAQLTGITTVADFRRRDIAAAGQGAPLAPLFHREYFHSAKVSRAIVNIGGMANISFISREGEVIGFDCGPGNVLMDAWHEHCRQHAFDRDGAWAATGDVCQALLQSLMPTQLLQQGSRPKSTGREDFHLGQLLEILKNHSLLKPVDIQATLLELTAQCIVESLTALKQNIPEVYLCGGGAFNKALVTRLQTMLSPRLVESTHVLGLAPDFVEATAFAWFAWRRLQGLGGNLPEVTGAGASVILGGIYSS